MASNMHWTWLAAGAAVTAVALANVKSWPFMYHLRLGASTLLETWRHGPVRLGEVTVVRCRATIDDLDINGHLNNAMYNKNADHGRGAYLYRLLHARGLHKRYRIFNGGVSMVFNREIKPFQAYEIRTRIAGWNKKWIVLVQHGTPTQTFHAGGRRVAHSASKMVVKEFSGKTVPPEEFFAAVGWDLDQLRETCVGWEDVVESLLAFESALAVTAESLETTAHQQ